ncbi:flagellar hook-length control protein FliK [Vibrio spartinae]|uniref:Flagellar hook-length control protein n=1 Tax=Vibrio spartinae TaxID=1918945 RepID=A0A1N6M0Q1_9VIBR|nr:flagellar hook-length control protein FliK [Vibrio spartinae]SIO92971.1 Flagellar hook-length control protein [Vibrio spartinae]
MNINLTPTSGTQKAQSHHKAVSDDAVVGDVAESSQESGGFFAKLAALFKGEDSASGKSSVESGETKGSEGGSDVAGDMSADALLSDQGLSDQDLSDQEVSGKELSKAEVDLSETQSQKHLSENIDDVDDAQIAAVKTSGGQHQHDGDTAALNAPRPESNSPSHATTSPSPLKPSEQSASSAQKDAALRTMGEGEAVLSRLKGAEQQLVSQNGNKLPASDVTEPVKHIANTVQSVNVTDADALQNAVVSSELPLSQVESGSASSQTQGKGSDAHQLTGEKSLTADLSQLTEASAQLNDSGPSVVSSAAVSSEVPTKDTVHRDVTISPDQIAAETNIRSVPNQNIINQNIINQDDMQNMALTDGVEHTQAAALSGTEGNMEKAALSQKLLQSLHQELPPRADPRHHTHMAQQQFAAQQLSQTTPVPVNPLTQAIQSDGSTNSLINLPGDSAASQAALQTLSASAVGREQWIRQRLAGFGDGKARPEGMIDDGTGKEGHIAHQLSSLAGQQTSGVQSHIRADAAQTPTSIYLAKDAMAADQLSERVQMMMSKNLKNIDIRLDPPELGRMHIRMNMSGDAATVHFTVATPQAREALEHSMPRLRDMLSQQGVQLGETSVQHQGSGHQQQGYAASGQGQSSGRGALPGQDSVFHDDNPDTGVKLDVDVSSQRDGISYYA